jgi:hypothetical protein
MPRKNPSKVTSKAKKIWLEAKTLTHQVQNARETWENALALKV